MAWRMGVDIGGTFTDVALVDEETGRIGIAKVPTTPRDFALGVIDGIKQGLARHRSIWAGVRSKGHKPVWRRRARCYSQFPSQV